MKVLVGSYHVLMYETDTRRMNHARDQYAVHAQEQDDSDLEVRPLKLSLMKGAAQTQLNYLVDSPTK